MPERATGQSLEGPAGPTPEAAPASAGPDPGGAGRRPDESVGERQAVDELAEAGVDVERLGADVHPVSGEGHGAELATGPGPRLVHRDDGAVP
jgi:hypothetical protein